MIKVLLIEDEEPAALRLQKLISKLAPNFEIIDCIDSVSNAVQWFETNPAPNLLLLDIQLADGLSFDIFKKVKVDSFVIFTTAYDEYAIKAFELNSIDYLLKPVNEEKLAASIQKFNRLNGQNNLLNVNDLISSLESKKNTFKKRFLINMGSKIKSVETNNIAFFYVLEKSTFLCTTEGKDYPIDFSLDKLETLIDTDLFFRINRQIMVNFNAIKKINVLSKSRIKLETVQKCESEMLVSANKSHQFREWLDR